MITHIPVLSKEVLEFLDLMPGQDVIDATVGHGGHAELILEATSPNGRLLAFDRDEHNLAIAKERLQKYGDRVTFVHDSYGSLEDQLYVHGFHQVDAILYDLGFSSAHVESADRGFSFRHSGPLDMRYDIRQELTAETIVNSWRADELANLFRRLGDERHAHKIAKRIVDERRRDRIRTTDRLAEIISSAYPGKGRTMRIHPATRVFQALRIAVNNELGELERTLPQAMNALKPGGRLLVISFHSLEDRIVKRFMKIHKDVEFSVLTKKPVTPTETEIKQNPRSRSAKLRVAERI